MDNSKEFQLMLDKAIESEPIAFKNFDRTKNVQGQLQEMLGCDCRDWLGDFTGLVYEEDDYSKQFTSMEQLWLAFVMEEKHDKRWDGSGWRNCAAK